MVLLSGVLAELLPREPELPPHGGTPWPAILLGPGPAEVLFLERRASSL